ncbi:MAG: Stigma-specific protein Stig1 [Thermomicrobiales bacterium]|nr:Stigma-specific protein Stig1 [Thermomicrobiales bacterium]
MPRWRSLPAYASGHGPGPQADCKVDARPIGDAGWGCGCTQTVGIPMKGVFMNAHAFDALVRALRHRGSRRAASALVFGIATALGGMVAPPRSTLARHEGRKKRKQRCRGRKRRCGRRCVDTTTNPCHCGRCGNRCQFNGVCVDGRCTCPNGDCAEPGLSCCPRGLAVDCTGFTANNIAGQFTELETCGFTTHCPEPRRCVGPRFQACCPPGSRCDHDTGTCLR